MKEIIEWVLFLEVFFIYQIECVYHIGIINKAYLFVCAISATENLINVAAQ